jgi:hypothetical protein
MQGLTTDLSNRQMKHKEVYQNAIKISYRLEENVLIVFVNGKRSLHDTLYYWEKIAQTCEENQLNNVQLTLALRGKFSPFDGIKNHQQVIDFLKSLDLNVALTDLNGLSQKDTQVACNMAASQGLNFAYFESEITASSWLNQFLLETV